MKKTTIKILGSSYHSNETREQNDFYATDPKALIDFLRAFNADGETLNERVWECSSGAGNLSNVMSERGHHVRSTDLIDRGFGECLDFLTVSENEKWTGDILTNPPYKHSEQFVQKAMSIIETGNRVFMLFKLQFVESKRRIKLFERYPIKYIYVHSHRIKIIKNNTDPVPNALCYAWFVWEKGFQGDAIIRWIK